MSRLVHSCIMTVDPILYKVWCATTNSKLTACAFLTNTDRILSILDLLRPGRMYPTNPAEMPCEHTWQNPLSNPTCILAKSVVQIIRIKHTLRCHPRRYSKVRMGIEVN